MPNPTTQSILVGLSGPTSSGKTTISSALATALPTSDFLLLHADDFYKPDSAIPIHQSGVPDWDCADSLDLPRFRQTLIDLKAGGNVPDKLQKQGGASDGVHASLSGIGNEYVEKLQVELQPLQAALRGKRLIIIEGFLLFGSGVKDQLAGLFDLGILLRATRQAAKRRRESRNGYVTLEGFWQDPEGYFDTVVWPNYVREHASWFEGGDVEGKPKESRDGEEILMGPVEDASLEDVCSWVVGCLRDFVNAGRL